MVLKPLEDNDGGEAAALWSPGGDKAAPLSRPLTPSPLLLHIHHSPSVLESRILTPPSSPEQGASVRGPLPPGISPAPPATPSHSPHTDQEDLVCTRPHSSDGHTRPPGLIQVEFNL